MSRILIDLTDIEGWQGHHGGTQRVVYGIAKQFYLGADPELEVEFIAFSPRDNSFYTTSFTPIYDRVENQEQTPMGQPSNTLTTARLKRLVQPYIPENIRKNKYARASAKNALSLSKRIAGKAKQNLRRPSGLLKTTPRGHRITFTKGDTVLILGKPWDNPAMEQVLIDEKARTGFILAQVIYDLIIPLHPQLHHPSLFKTYTQYVFNAIYGSDLLLPISKSTDKDIKSFAKSLNLPMPRTKVLRLADEITSQPGKSHKPDTRIANSFIACVGTVEIRKNHTLLYYAYKLAEQQGIKLPQLVIVGSRGWLSEDFQYLIEHDPSMKDKIIILDNISDQGLAWIYSNCQFSVYPSFYEGWGLPVAESLASGKVCIAANTSSIPEIAGDLIDYFSPYDAGDCLKLMATYLDPHYLQQKQTDIKSYKPTSWDDTSKTVLAAIASAQNTPH